jgi:hypothetical protein
MPAYPVVRKTIADFADVFAGRNRVVYAVVGRGDSPHPAPVGRLHPPPMQNLRALEIMETPWFMRLRGWKTTALRGLIAARRRR